MAGPLTEEERRALDIGRGRPLSEEERRALDIVAGAPAIPPAQPPPSPPEPVQPAPQPDVRIEVAGMHPAVRAKVRQHIARDPLATREWLGSVEQAIRVGALDPAAPDFAARLAGLGEPATTSRATYEPPVGAGLLTPMARLAGVVAGVASVLVPGRRGGAGVAPFVDAYQVTEEDLRQRWEDSYGTGMAGFLDDVATDASDNVVALMDVVAEVVGGRGATVEEWEGPIAGLLSAELGRGTDFGRALAGGAVGGVAGLVASPVRFAKTRTVTFLLTVGPLLRSPQAQAAMGRLSAPSRAALGRLADAADAARKAVPPVDALFTRLWRHGDHTRWQGFVRWFGDQYRQPGVTYSQLVERIMTKGDDVRREVEAAMAKAARGVESGGLTKAAVSERFEGMDLVDRHLAGEVSAEELRAAARGETELAVFDMLERTVGEPAEVRRGMALDGFESASDDARARVIVEGAVERAREADGAPPSRARRLDIATDEARGSAGTATPGVHRSMLRHVETGMADAVGEIGALGRRVVDLRQGLDATGLRAGSAGAARAEDAILQAQADILRLRAAVDRARSLRTDLPEGLLGTTDPAVHWQQAVPLEIPTEGPLAAARRVAERRAALADDPGLAQEAARRRYGALGADEGRRHLFGDTHVLALEGEGRMVARAERVIAEDPAFRELVESVHRQIADAFHRSDVVQDVKVRHLRPEAEIEALRTEAGGPRWTFDDTLRVMASALRDDSVQLLRSPEFRRRVVRRILRARPGMRLSRKGLDVQLRAMAESTLVDRPWTYTIEGPGGPTVDLYAEMVRTIPEVPDRLLRPMRAEAMRSLGSTLAAEAYNRTASQAMYAEIRRFSDSTTVDLPAWIDNLADRVLVRGEPRPLLVNRFDPAEIGQEMRQAGVAAELASSVRQRAGEALDAGGLLPADEVRLAAIMEPGNAEAAVGDLADAMRFSYTRPSAALLIELPMNLLAVEDLPPGVQLPRGKAPVAIRAADHGFNSTAGRHFAMVRSMAETDDWLHSFVQGFKEKATIISLPTQIHNVASNVVMLSVTSGRSPLGVIADALGAGRRWRRWVAGKVPDGSLLARDLRAMERTGLVNSTLVDAELTLAESGGLIGEIPGGERAAELIAKFVRRPAAALYGAGDNLFKLDVAGRAMRSMRADLGLLLPGEVYELRQGKHLTTWAVRTKAGWKEVPARPHDDPARNLGRLRGERPLSDADLDVRLAKAAAGPANAFMFDYGDIPNWVKHLRTSRLTGPISPFVTWAWKSLDLGKRGLWSHVLGAGQIITPSTTSRAVRLRHLRLLAGASARRTMLMAAVRTALLERPEDALRPLLKYGGRGAATTLIDAVTDPSLVPVQGADPLFFGGATDALLRVAAGAVLAMTETPEALLPDAAALAAMDPAQRRAAQNVSRLHLRNRGGEVWGWEDVFDLAALSGEPISKALMEMYTAARRNEAMDHSHLAELAATMAVGVTGARVADVALAVADPSSPLTTRSRTRRLSPAEVDGLAHFAFVRLVGRGWRNTDTEAARRKAIRRTAAAARASLTAGFDRRIKAMEVDRDAAAERSDPGRAAELEAALTAVRQDRDRADAVVVAARDEIGRRWDEAQALLRAASVPGRPRLSEERRRRDLRAVEALRRRGVE